ncbi:MAG TPA: DUF551 domain-containing protein [Aquella sp.]|nr:DUF551 domain-containing protein [Aquella sp.]
MNWINVKNKLPKNKQDILLLLKYEKYDDDLELRNYKIIIQGYMLQDGNYLSYFFYCPHIGFKVDDESFKNFELNINAQYLDIPNEWVTHWMPFPELLQE